MCVWWGEGCSVFGGGGGILYGVHVWGVHVRGDVCVWGICVCGVKCVWSSCILGDNSEICFMCLVCCVGVYIQGNMLACAHVCVCVYMIDAGQVLDLVRLYRISTFEVNTNGPSHPQSHTPLHHSH